MKLTKESLIDWTVTDNGKRIASITRDFKIKTGYNVKFTEQDGAYFILGFTTAKKFIADNL